MHRCNGDDEPDCGEQVQDAEEASRHVLHVADIDVLNTFMRGSDKPLDGKGKSSEDRDAKHARNHLHVAEIDA